MQLLAEQKPYKASRSPALFQAYRNSGPESYYAAAPVPGSPTELDEDEDGDEFVTPPSPTLSSQSAQRRVQASSHAHFALGSISRKRPFDKSDETGNLTKLTKSSKGKQPFDKPISTNPFKEPTLDMARSYQARSMISSVNTSFNTMNSSPQTQPDTAMTSFTSNVHDGDVIYPNLTRTSSTTIESLDEHCLLSVSAKLEREAAGLGVDRSQASQEMSHETSPTFGSVDEDGLLETSFHLEAELAVPPITSLRPSTPPSTNSAQVDDMRRGPQPSRDVCNTGTTHSYNSTTSLSPAHVRQPRRSPRTSFPSTVTPTEALGDSMKNSSNGKSPSKLPYYIRNIPGQHLFTGALADELKRFPYFLLFICYRISCNSGVSMRKLMHGMDVDDVKVDSLAFWDTLEANLETLRQDLGHQLKKQIAKVTYREQARVWTSARKNFDGYTFKGRLLFNLQDRGPVFDLELLPIQADKSCRFQRKFGSHRFLYLNVPPFESKEKTKPSRFNGDEMKQIEQQWKIWFRKEHSFLGRKWKAFHVEPIKRKAGRVRVDNSDKRMILFATEGIGIEDPMSIGEMLNWFFPFASNMDQSFCKAYSRIDLGLSRTIPTLAFKPSQILRVDDIKADGLPEDTRFNDPTLTWDERPEPGTVMNDGCSRMSVGAALAIWRTYSKVTETREPIPSVFQGRIGGAKGIWMVCGEPSTSNAMELEIWIEITPSQLKFEFHEEDRFDDLMFDEIRLTFEHVDHSSKPGASDLHISFIPILVDRGVSPQIIASLIISRLDLEREELLQVLPKPNKLYHWLYRLSRSITDEDVPWQAAMPQSLPNKISHLLETGFHPQQEPYLANLVCRYLKQHQIWMEQKLRVPLGKATFFFGIADPLGVLAPGEVHIDFSSPFVDAVTGATYRSLNNIDILVARQPACRPSDIQKVRAVKRPELSHMVDVVVFSSRGQYPLAGKLQGGDYDGDKFWLCWEPDLVHPFQNAPAPLTALLPQQYGIRKDTRTLREVMTHRELSTVDNLLKEVLDFRMAPNLLGVVTNFLEKQAYKENRLSSTRLNALYDMHDLLVDAPKNGYIFSQADYNYFIRSELRCGNPKQPAYKKAMEDCENAKELGEAEKVREKNYNHKQDNILDYLYFEVLRKHDVDTLKKVKDSFSKEVSDDPALQYPYIDLRDHGSDIVRTELGSLVKKFKDIERIWLNKIMGKAILTSDGYNDAIDSCHRKFRSLIPTQADHQDIKPLLHPYLDFNFSVWESVRASALYTTLPKRHTLVWQIAGRELAKIKCAPLPGAKLVASSIFASLKPKPDRMPKPEEDEESEGEFEFALEHVS
jgi:hypothetical protein